LGRMAAFGLRAGRRAPTREIKGFLDEGNVVERDRPDTNSCDGRKALGHRGDVTRQEQAMGSYKSFADEWIFVGTHTGPFPLPDGTELPATGKRVEVSGMEFVQMRDGKIVVDNLYYDNLSIAAQLGLLPQPAPVSAS
jgi:hypothetical protein